MDPKVISRWIEKIKRRDPALHKRLTQRLAKEKPDVQRAALEGLVVEAAPAAPMIALETIVEEVGRPAIPIRNNLASYDDAYIDAQSKVVVDSLKAASAVINPVIPLVGRIDVENFPSNIDFIGTGWQIEPGLLVTNRHVAELVARRQGDRFTFRTGRFGDPMDVSVDYLHELNNDSRDAAEVTEILWIEEDPAKADIAFLKIAERGGGLHQNRIPISETDADPGEYVAVIGYPARAPDHIIRDQALMDKLYGSTYDIKRIAPGLMDDDSRGWATHDCTTLGGNSGSVVLRVATGEAVALHFAGLYMIENYAVHASTIRAYLRDRPWQGTGTSGRRSESQPSAQQQVGAQQSVSTAPGTTAQLTVPVTISVSIGEHGTPLVSTLGSDGSAQTIGIDEAVNRLAQEKRGHGILAIRASYVSQNGFLTDQDSIVVAAHPDAIERATAHIGMTHYEGYPIEIEPASIDDQLAPGGIDDDLTEVAKPSLTMMVTVPGRDSVSTQ